MNNILYKRQNTNNITSISNNNIRTNYYNGSTINEASTMYQKVGNDNMNAFNSSSGNVCQIPYKPNLTSNNSKNKQSKNYAQNITNSKNGDNNKKELTDGMNPRPEKEDKCCCLIF